MLLIDLLRYTTYSLNCLHAKRATITKKIQIIPIESMNSILIFLSFFFFTCRNVLPSSRNKRNGISKSMVFRSSAHPVVVRYCDPDTAHIGCLIPAINQTCNLFICRKYIYFIIMFKLKAQFEKLIGIGAACTLYWRLNASINKWKLMLLAYYIHLLYNCVHLLQSSYRSINVLCACALVFMHCNAKKWLKSRQR